MIRILIVKDANLRSLGVLDRAFAVSVNRRVNSVWQASFSLPIDDDKAELATHLNYVDVYGPSGRSYGLYRIVPSRTRRRQKRIDYECEHVISTLLDDVMDGYFQYTNMTTQDVLADILAKQTVKRWQLGDVDITRYFHYKFENENGLLAPVLSVPMPFDEPYEFEYDTSTYPWTLHLRRPSDKITSELRWGRDMRDFEEHVDPSNIVNYIVPKGAGEGVNQLTIADVNNGVRFLKDDASIAKWGRQSYIWVDRRFEDAESLKASAKALLDEWKEPRFSFEADAVDLTIRDGQERRLLNGVTAIYVGKDRHLARIIGENIKDLSKEYDVTYEIANRVGDVSTTQTSIERKQQVNDAYSQGSTNILNADRVDNADPTHPIRFKIRIPEDAVNVNFMELTWDTEPFRGYTRGSEAGGQFVQGSTVQSKSTKGGGGQTTTSGGGQTTSSGGGQTTSSGGGQTSSAGGDHRHVMFTKTDQIGPVERNTFQSQAGLVDLYSSAETLTTAGSSGNHSHTVSNHTHTVQAHTHTVQAHSHAVSDHTHDFEVTIPGIDIKPHTHKQIYGIYEHDKMPSRLEIKVDGTAIPHTALSGENVELTPYLKKDAIGKVERDRFAIVEIRPTNELAQINASIIWGLFVQSHKGGNY